MMAATDKRAWHGSAPAILTGCLVLALPRTVLATWWGNPCAEVAGPEVTASEVFRGLLGLAGDYMLGVIAGYVTARLAGRAGAEHALIVVGLTAAFSLCQIILSPDLQTLCYQVTFVLLVIPATLGGGLLGSVTPARDRRPSDNLLPLLEQDCFSEF